MPHPNPYIYEADKDYYVDENGELTTPAKGTPLIGKGGHMQMRDAVRYKLPGAKMPGGAEPVVEPGGGQ